MATLLKVLNNLADIKSAGGVALRVRTQGASTLSVFMKLRLAIVVRIAAPAHRADKAVTNQRLAIALRGIANLCDECTLAAVFGARLRRSGRPASSGRRSSG
jgi:hypothetical protein